MKYKSLSAFAVLMASTAFTLVPTVSQAMMKGNLGFVRPMTDWRIGEIVAPAEGVEGYCASVNKFEQGFTVALAKAKNGNYSFAIDFPQKRFKSGETLPISLQHSQGYSLQTQARAVNSKSLILQLGQEDLLFAAMSNEGYLNISLPELDVKMSLATFSKSAEKLQNCVDSLIAQPIVIQEVRAIPPQMPAGNTLTPMLATAPESTVTQTSDIAVLEKLSPAAGEAAAEVQAEVVTETTITETTQTIETEITDEEALRQRRLSTLEGEIQAVPSVEAPTVSAVEDVTPTQSTDDTSLSAETEMGLEVQDSPSVPAEPAAITEPSAPAAVLETKEVVEIRAVPVSVPAIADSKPSLKPSLKNDQARIDEQIAALEKSNRELEVARNALAQMPQNTSVSQKALQVKMEAQKQEIAALKASTMANTPEVEGKSSIRVEQRPILNLDASTNIAAPTPPVAPQAPVIQPTQTIEQNMPADDTVEKLIDQYEPRAGGQAHISDAVSKTAANKKEPVSLTWGLGSPALQTGDIYDGIQQAGFQNVQFRPSIDNAKFKQVLWNASANGIPFQGSISTYKQLSADNFSSHATGFVRAFKESQCAIAGHDSLKVLSARAAIANMTCPTSAGAKNISMVFYLNANQEFSVLHYEGEIEESNPLLHNINGTLIQYISSANHDMDSGKNIEMEKTVYEQKTVDPI